jgi:hypothetical protein
MSRPIGTRMRVTTWEELEAILLWRSLGFPIPQIAVAMGVSAQSASYHIYEGRRAHAHVAKLSTWRGYGIPAKSPEFLA